MDKLDKNKLKELLNSTFKKVIPNDCIHEYYKNNNLEYLIIIDFFLILKTPLFCPSDHDAWNRFNNSQAVTLTYSHEYTFKSDYGELEIKEMKKHKEYIENEMSNRFKELGDVGVYFRKWFEDGTE